MTDSRIIANQFLDLAQPAPYAIAQTGLHSAWMDAWPVWTPAYP